MNREYRYFVTERLVVREWLLDDIAGLLKVMSDVRVHTYTKDKNNPWDRQRTEKYIRFMVEKEFRSLDNYHGAVIEKKTNQIIGLCGLNPYKEREPEIEWKLGVPFWGKGYATELGIQMIEEAFAATNIKGIYGMAQPGNTASRRVLEKIGMEYIGNQAFRDCEDAFYYISNPCCLAEAKNAFYALREQSADVPEMLLEEINAEIKATRAERKSKCVWYITWFGGDCDSC